MMLGEHILTYIFSFIKRYDVRKNGEIGANGVETTSLCMTLDGFSYFMQCINGLLTILHLVQMKEQRHALPLINYILVVDLTVSMLLIPYIYLSKRRQVTINTMRNIHALTAVQKVK